MITKIAFWRKVKENCSSKFFSPKNGCNGIDCDLCPVKSQDMCDLCYVEKNFKKALAYANKQIKIHESKSKKKLKIDLSPFLKKETARLKAEKENTAVKTDVRDMKNVVKDEVGISQIDVINAEGDLSVNPNQYIKPDPTPLDIAKMIRDNNYGCYGLKWLDCNKCPFDDANDCSKPETIDTYISDHSVDPNKKVEPVIEPILPDVVYVVTDDEIKKCKTEKLDFKVIGGKLVAGILAISRPFDYFEIYKTLADAVRVAEEKWSVK